jgi:hypothetical protein
LEAGAFKGRDGRGKKAPANKTPEIDIKMIKEHIESFPKIESHYARKDSKRQYLQCGMSINKMYDLYRQTLLAKGQRPVTSHVYRRVFCEDYNLSFFKPKKDICLLCNSFITKEERGLSTATDKEKYQDHIKMKERAREEKGRDKERAQKDNTFYSATFDLEAVLYTPCSNVSQIFYKRKLSCYNFTVFSLGNKHGTCYLWDESEGGRGSSEIGSCLLMHLKSLPKTVKHVSFFSDACSGQNRNQYVAAALLHAVRTIPNIETITHKFLETGHTHMECDSMHSAIESAKKATSIFIPSQWDTVIRMARRNNPFVVIPLNHQSIWDLKKLAGKICKNLKVDQTGKRVNWMKIKVMKFCKSHTDTLQYKYNFDDEFETISTNARTRGRPSTDFISNLELKYDGKLKISKPKKDDLIALCKSLVIPPEFHGFYEKLEAGNNVKDRLPLPDADETDYDSDE